MPDAIAAEAAGRAGPNNRVDMATRDDSQRTSGGHIQIRENEGTNCRCVPEIVDVICSCILKVLAINCRHIYQKIVNVNCRCVLRH